jgi:hypothetical protein
MTSDREFDEPDFAKHVANVIQDAVDHTVTVDEAIEAILEHPVAKAGMRLKIIGPLDADS